MRVKCVTALAFYVSIVFPTTSSVLVQGRYSVNVEGRSEGPVFPNGTTTILLFRKSVCENNDLSNKEERKPKHVAPPHCQAEDVPKVKELHKGRALIFSLKDEILILFGLGLLSGFI